MQYTSEVSRSPERATLKLQECDPWALSGVDSQAFSRSNQKAGHIEAR